MTPANDAPYRLLRDVELGEGVVVQAFTNLYGCRIGDLTRVGPFVEIQSGVEIGAGCKIQSHSFICTGVTIEDEVFVGHGVIFINDKRPRATTGEGVLQTDEDWELIPTVVERRASIGSGASAPSRRTSLLRFGRSSPARSISRGQRHSLGCLASKRWRRLG